MKNVRAPQFLGNLYRDLRDRHLLLPAVALVVGMLAVAILLKNHSSSPSSAPTETKNAGALSAAVPAVASQQLGVTNYKERLDRLASKNPFHQQYTGAPPSARVHVAASALAPSSSSTSSATTSSVSTASGYSSTSTATTTSAEPATATSPPVSSGGGTSAGSSSGGAHSIKPGFRVYTLRASVKVGEPNKLQDRPEVEKLTMLPTEGKPIVTYLGASEDASHAFFLVGPEVDSVKGDGRCIPSHSSCEYVVMEPGDKASFHYAPNGERYNLVLVDIHPVDITDKFPKHVHGKSQPQQKAPLVLPG